LIGAALLLAACINFVNLNTALALRRAKEVGVRKVLGSTQSRLVAQFVGETALLSLTAIFLSLAVAEIASGQLTFILGYQLKLNLFGDATIAFYLTALFVTVTLAAGFYPAVYLSRFSPINALRQKNATRYREGLPLRRGLAVVQFAITQALILSTVIIGSQMHYLRKADMGFNKEAIVEVSLPQRDDDKLTRLKTLLLQHPAVTRVSFSNTGAASGNSWSGNYKLTVGSEVKEANAQVKFVDEDFLETYELQLLAGADHARTDSVWQYLVNEAFVAEAGFAGKENELLGKPVEIWGRKGHVNGIVKNFNTKSLHNEMTPVMMLVQNRYFQAGIKIDMRQVKEALAAIEAAWSAVYPENVFDYGFLDESIAKFYEDEEKTAALINTFTVIAIVIGCMGLLGLVSYMATQRTKEIGIRKVLGATVTNVTALLSKDFVKLVLLANVIAWPVAWWAMNKWLQNFAYRIDVGWWVFALAGGLALLIALLTVSTQAIRAALANPVEALRYE
jgi:ABC-type antimicrobial peptide transport system permease subunit